MAEAPTFEEIVRAWVLYYDDRLPSDRKERREAFITLLGNLADHGYDKQELTNNKKEKIIKFCLNPNYRDKKKLRSWFNLLVNDLEAAILIFYPIIKIRDNVVTPEMQTKLENMERKAEETKALKTNTPSNDSEETELTIDEVRDTLDDPELTVSKPSKIRDFEITDDMLSDIEGPEIIYDPNFYKDLGIENE